MLPDFMWIMIGALLGVLFRFMVPFLRKMKEDNLTWRDVDTEYIVEAVLAFFTSYLLIFGMLESLAIPAIPWMLFLAALVAGVGNMEILNELIKVLTTMKTKEE